MSFFRAYALLIVLTLGGVMTARPALAASPVAIDACGTELARAGAYVLSRDIGPCPEDGLVISASDVDLDLAGHTILGSELDATCVEGAAHIGIHVLSGADRVTVRGGSVSQFKDGLDASGSAARIQGMQLTDNCAAGFVATADNNVLADSQVRGNTYGIVLCSSTNAVISNNNISENDVDGIAIGCDGGSNLTVVVGNTLYGNGKQAGVGSAVAVYVGSGNVFTSNSVRENVDGIALINGDQNIVERNEVLANVNTGISAAAESTGNAITCNFTGENGLDLVETNACAVNLWHTNQEASVEGCVD